MKTRSQTAIKSNHVGENSDSDSSVYSDLEEELKEEDSNSSDDSKAQDESVSSDSDSQKNKSTINRSNIQKKSEKNVKEKKDEYEHDSSDEEDLRNTVGNIPMNWYDDYPHIGYDLEGKRIIKPLQDDEIDNFLKKLDDPNYWRTVRDKMTGQNVLLTDEDVDIIKRIQTCQFPDASFNAFEPFEDFFTYKTMEHPVTNAPEHKRSFIPSKIEKEKVARLVYAIKMGWIKPKKPHDDSPKFYMLWNKENTDVSKRIQHYIPAPKLKLPGHEESYNPPPEYLFSKEEEEQWKEQEPEERKLSFIPRKYSCLRKLPAYPEFIKDRFERCLDLYLCPRQRKMRVNVDPNDLIPKLPKPKDLQPFPTIQSLIYIGHSDMVRCISVEPAGQFFASGSDDKTVKIWEILTGRCLRTHYLGEIVNSLEWCPNQGFCLLLAAAGKKAFIINPAVGDKMIISNTDDILRNPPKIEDAKEDKKVVEWVSAEKEQWASGIRLVITHPNEIKQVTWHGKGDYFASLMPNAGNKSVIIHQLSCWRSQVPFQKMKQSVQRILFHPVRPFFFVATQRYVRMYNLLKQELTKKLMTNCKWVSSLAVHSQGDNIIIGSYDSRLSWFDLDLSTKPYKTLRHHKKAIRQVAFHKRYPLFASASDDGSVIVCHGMVYSDLLQNPLIVPVKVLKGHKTTQSLSVLDCCFHPLQPWIFSAGADSTIRLYT